MMKKTFFPLLLLACLFAFVACNQSQSDKIAEATTETKEAIAKPVKKINEAKNAGYQIGDKASDFKLKNIDEETVSLADYKDAKGFIITFTCNHCPYAVMYEDRLIELHKKAAAMGYPVVAINPNDPEVVPEDGFEEMKTRAKEKAFPFAYLYDEGQKVYPQYGATKTPHVFLLDKSLTVRYIGAIDDSAKDASAVSVNYVENAIQAIEKGTDPDPATTKAIGCSIKTKKS